MNQRAQFFIISTIIVSFTLVGIQFLFAGYNLADASKPFTFQEDYFFNDVRSALNYTFYTSPCPLTERNLDEVKLDTEKRARHSRWLLNVTFTDPCTGSGELSKQSTTFFANLTSFNYNLYDEFTLAP